MVLHPQLVAGILPWLGLSCGMASVGAGRRPPARLQAGASARRLGGRRSSCFFSLSGSKLPGYIFRSFRPSRSSPRWRSTGWTRRMAPARARGRCPGRRRLRLPCRFLLSARRPTRSRARRSAPTPARWRVLLALTLCGLAAALWRGPRPCRGGASRSMPWRCSSLVGDAALVAHETFGRERSGVDLVAPIAGVLGPGMPIYSVRLLDHTLPFYLRRTTIMVEAPDELEFGVKREPEKWLPTLARSIAVWPAGRPGAGNHVARRHSCCAPATARSPCLRSPQTRAGWSSPTSERVPP